MNRTREWVSTLSIEEAHCELLSGELEHSIPEWMARIHLCSLDDDTESNAALTPMEIKYESKLG